MQVDASPKWSVSEPVWLFGYGSLIWKINFPYQEKVTGFVNGFARRFWQGSTDHRGSIQAPGRVVTLVPSKEDKTWGIAYKVDPEDIPETMANLERREIDGYKTYKVDFYPADTSGHSLVLKVIVYIATDNNPSYLGPAVTGVLAKHIVKSRGFSGCNVEYALELAKAMREIAPHVQDHHLFELEAEIKLLLQERKLEQNDSNNSMSCSCQYCI